MAILLQARSLKGGGVEKRLRIGYALLAAAFAMQVLACASSFVWQPSSTDNPLAQAYQNLSVGMEEKKVYAVMQTHMASEPYAWTNEEILAHGEVPGWEKPPEIGVSYVQWPWDGKLLESEMKIPDLLTPTDYEEHAYLHVQFKDGKVKNAWYTYYRYLYRSGTDECRTRGYYYSKTECLVPDKTCPSETKYQNLEPCKDE